MLIEFLLHGSSLFYILLIMRSDSLKLCLTVNRQLHIFVVSIFSILSNYISFTTPNALLGVAGACVGMLQSRYHLRQ